MKPPGENALTLIETLVALVIVTALVTIIAVLIFAQRVTPTVSEGQMLQMQSNMRQIHLATLSMVLDEPTFGEKSLRWPGNLNGSFSEWARLLVPSYLGTNDFCRLLSGPGMQSSPMSLPDKNSNAVLVYAVTEDSAGSTVFLSSANFTNSKAGGYPPTTEATPFGAKGFVVFRKDGTGNILKTSAAGETNRVGSFVPLCQ